VIAGNGAESTPTGTVAGPDHGELISLLRETSQKTAFNNWLGLELSAAEPGEIELRLQ